MGKCHILKPTDNSVDYLLMAMGEGEGGDDEG